MTDGVSPDAVATAVENELRRAAVTGTPCAPVRERATTDVGGRLRRSAGSLRSRSRLAGWQPQWPIAERVNDHVVRPGDSRSGARCQHPGLPRVQHLVAAAGVSLTPKRIPACQPRLSMRPLYLLDSQTASRLANSPEFVSITQSPYPCPT